MGADINDVRRGIGHDARIGFQFLFPGAGFGGSCFPKDIRSLLAMSRQTDVPLHLMSAVDRVNESQKSVLFAKVRQHFDGKLRGKTLAIWGLAFKPRTDDVRDAPALVLIDALLAEGVQLRVHDPEAMANVKAIYGDRLIYWESPYPALDGADGLAIVTEWQEFRHPDFAMMLRRLRQPVIFDGRNLYEPRQMTELGFTYYGIGAPLLISRSATSVVARSPTVPLRDLRCGTVSDRATSRDRRSPKVRETCGQVQWHGRRPCHNRRPPRFAFDESPAKRESNPILRSSRDNGKMVQSWKSLPTPGRNEDQRPVGRSGRRGFW